MQQIKSYLESMQKRKFYQDHQKSGISIAMKATGDSDISFMDIIK